MPISLRESFGLRCVLVALGALAAACAASDAGPRPRAHALELRAIDSSVLLPGQLALYFVADRTDGKAPVPPPAEQLRIYEDGQLISPYEAKHLITTPVPFVHYILVLADLSSSVAPERIQAVQDAAQTFVARADPMRKVALYVFDGSRQLMRLKDFEPGDQPSSVPAINSALLRDPSTNLHGAIVDGIQLLRFGAAKAEQAIKFGTLVVISDGTDRARWRTQEEMYGALDRGDVDVFVVGIGAELDRPKLERIGKDGIVLVEPQPGELESALRDLFARIDAYGKQFYLLSYCSPARSGSHELRIEAPDPEGKIVKLEKKFSADGFQPGCDPQTPPPIGEALQKPQRLRARATTN